MEYTHVKDNCVTRTHQRDRDLRRGSVSERGLVASTTKRLFVLTTEMYNLNFPLMDRVSGTPKKESGWSIETP